MAVNENKCVYRGEQRTDIELGGGDAASHPPANVRDFGAVGDGSADDTVPIQEAIDEALEAATIYGGVYFPPGRYRVTDTINIGPARAFRIWGAGATVVQDAGDSAINRGALIIADGVTGPVLNIDACSGFRISNIAIRGNTTDTLVGAAPVGIRLQNRVGYGSGNGLIEQVCIHWCEVGFDAGGIDPGDPDHNNSNSADLTFLRCTTTNVTTAFLATDDQQVNYGFYDFSVTDAEECFRLVGGNLFVSMLSTYDVEKIVVVQDAGTNIGHVTVINVKSDGTAHRTRLYVAEADATARAVFRDVHFNVGQLAVAGDTRCHLMHGHRVRIYVGANLCNATAALFSLDGNSAGGCSILVHGCEIPNNSGHVVGTVVNGTYRIRDCFDEAGDFITDYPVSSSYTTVEDEGSGVTQRSTMNFTGAGVSVADSGGKTVVTIAGGGVSDGDKGDITVSGGGATWSIDAGAVTLAQMANMATSSVFYRKTAGAGAPEVQTLATLKTDLGLTGTNSGDQTLYNQTIEDEGTPVTQRGTINFTGAGVSVADSGGKTVVTIGGGSGSATTVEKDLGSTPVSSGRFTITDAAISPTSKVLCWQAPGPYTGKGTRADEAIMQPVSVVAVEPGSGSATVYWQTPPMIAVSRNEAHTTAGRTPVGATFDRLVNQREALGGAPKRIGKVRKNVKFTYMIL